MLKNTYFLNENNDIVIYGAGKTGILIANTLAKNGYNIKCFIDEYCNNFTLKNIVKLEEYQYKKNDIIIISLNNGIENEKIAYMINKKYACNKIVFIPMKIEMSSIRKYMLKDFISNLMNGVLIDNIPIPLFTYESEKYKIINDLNYEYIDLWAPITLLSSSIDISTYLDLFAYLENGNTNLEKYIVREKENKRRFINIDELIKDRLSLYELYKEELGFGTSFFENSPILVKLESKNRFIPIEGMHRISFLIKNNFKHIPVRMKFEEYVILKEEIINE